MNRLEFVWFLVYGMITEAKGAHVENVVNTFKYHVANAYDVRKQCEQDILWFYCNSADEDWKRIGSHVMWAMQRLGCVPPNEVFDI